MGLQLWTDVVAVVTYHPSVTKDDAERFELAVQDAWKERNDVEGDMLCTGQVHPRMVSYFLCDLEDADEEELVERVVAVALDLDVKITIRTHREYNVDEETEDQAVDDDEPQTAGAHTEV